MRQKTYILILKKQYCATIDAVKSESEFMIFWMLILLVNPTAPFALDGLMYGLRFSLL